MGRDMPPRGPPARDLRRDDPDRRRHQPGQLRGAAPQHARRGDRHQHHDHHRRSAGQRRASASPSRSTWRREILPQLREKGKVVRGWMGVNIQPVSEDLAGTYGLSEGKGAYVSAVTPGSPAEKAGLQPEDVILSADAPHHPGQQRPLALHLLEEPGRDGQARRPARQGQEVGVRDPRHVPGQPPRRARPRTAAGRASA